VRARPLGLHVVAGLVVAGLAAGCSGSTTASVTTTSRPPVPAGAVPSPISVQICSHEAHRYSCTCDYPAATPTGSFTVSVTELSSWPETYAFYDGLATTLGNSRDLESLGQAAFQTTDGSVVVRKDWKVLEVDNSGLPSQFGIPPTSSGAVAVTVADVILGCWAGD
jgi:hypothetical protein